MSEAKTGRKAEALSGSKVLRRKSTIFVAWTGAVKERCRTCGTIYINKKIARTCEYLDNSNPDRFLLSIGVN